MKNINVSILRKGLSILEEVKAGFLHHQTAVKLLGIAVIYFKRICILVTGKELSSLLCPTTQVNIIKKEKKYKCLRCLLFFETYCSFMENLF